MEVDISNIFNIHKILIIFTICFPTLFSYQMKMIIDTSLGDTVDFMDYSVELKQPCSIEI